MKSVSSSSHRVSVTLLALVALSVTPAPARATATEGVTAAAPTITGTPPAESNYTARPACPPPAPGYAGCLALELTPRTAAARAQAQQAQADPKTITECEEAFPSACLTPQDLRDAYFPAPSEPPEAPASEPQTIALVDAYNDPKAQADLETYEEAFGLRQCPAASNACFEQVNQNGETDHPPFPATEGDRQTELLFCENTHLSWKAREAACENVVEAEGWAIEISTDIEVARGICHNCKILLVETDSQSYEDLEAGEETAYKLKATEISDSWGGEQPNSESPAFDHPGTVLTAAAGDNGYLNWTDAQKTEEAKQECLEEAAGPTERALCETIGYPVSADYPAGSPHVVAVGGTKLTLSAGVRQSETVWNEDPDPENKNSGAGGGGCSSEAFEAPAWQQAVPDWSQVGCGSRRAVADVAADADPYTGVAVYDSVPNFSEENGKLVNRPLDWWPIGGTSVASPIIASMFALAGGAHKVEYPAKTLYTHLETTGLYDVTKGGNGRCDDLYVSCSGSLDQQSTEFAFDCGEDAFICNAAPGCGNQYYDGPTGVGTPNGVAAFKPGAIPPIVKPECATKNEGGGSKTTTGDKGSSSGAEGSQDETNGQENTNGQSTTGSTFNPSGSVTPNGQTTTSNTSPPATTKRAPRISSLALTAAARAALRRPRPVGNQLAFSCVLSQAATVRVTLSLEIRSAGHTQWRTLPGSFTFDAIKALDRRRLRDTAHLLSGTYRLTLTPADGKSRSISIRIA
jgi:hypothetical protein